MIGAGSSEIVYDVVVVGAGAAGLGAAVALKHAGIENFIVCERQTVGASFVSWPAETRCIRMAVGRHRSDCDRRDGLRCR